MQLEILSCIVSKLTFDIKVRFKCQSIQTSEGSSSLEMSSSKDKKKSRTTTKDMSSSLLLKTINKYVMEKVTFFATFSEG